MKQCWRSLVAPRALFVVGLLAMVVLAGCSTRSRSKSKKSSAKPNSEAVDYVKLGDKYMGKGDKRRAIDAYSKAIKADDRCAEAYSSRAMLYNEVGQPQKAVADYTKAIKLNPNTSYPYEQLAVIYRDHFHDSAKANLYDKQAKEIREKARSQLRERVNRKRAELKKR